MPCEHNDWLRSARQAILFGWICAVLSAASGSVFAQALRGHNSCSSIGCHGGVQGQGPVWNSSLSTYLLHDPHARAYQVLHRADSHGIVDRYQKSVGESDDGIIKREGDKYTAGPQYNDFINRHCANCHASTQPETPTVNLGLISCESCHGVASEPDGWLAQHVQGREESNPQFWEGFKDLRNLHVRAETCIDCHVGTVATGSQPPREVTHDLIAAGHPAMRFEFASYLASLPAHWDEAQDRWFEQTQKGIELGPDRERAGTFWRQSYSLGKIQSVNRSLELLREQHRNTDSPFPDFAQFDCFSCHQSLRIGLKFRNDESSRLQWLAWHGSGLHGERLEQLRPIRDALRKFEKPAAIELLNETPEASIDIVQAIDNSGQPSWENAAQSYLAYYACYLDFLDGSVSRGSLPPMVPNVTPELLANYRRLLAQTAVEELQFSEHGDLNSPAAYHARNRASRSGESPIQRKLSAMREAAKEMKIRLGK